MIELPDHLGPSSATPALLDFGVTLRPATGGPVQKVQRAGSRYRVEFTLPAMYADDARVFVSRLIEAKRIGHLVIPFPLAISQGAPGSPVVDGAGQTGTTLNIRGLIPGYLFREGYWLTIKDAYGQRYLFNCRSTVPADTNGEATIKIEPPLRVPHPDGAQILLANPEIEGFLDGGEWTWTISPTGITELSFTVEEVA